MSFVRRRIDLTFVLNGQSGVKSNTATPTSQFTVTGLKVDATITKPGGTGMGEARLRVYGMTLQQMQQISTYGYPPNIATVNEVLIQAGDDQSGMATIAQGYIKKALIDFSQQPDVCLSIEAFTTSYLQVKPIPPTSINGAADVASMLNTLAGQMGLQFENNGVNVKLSNPYHWGPAKVQVDEICQAANIYWTVEGKTLAIWPKTSSRAGAPVLIAAGDKLVGYPNFVQFGVLIKSLLDPTIEYGKQIKVQSSVTNANGVWTVTNIVYELQSETPGGAWFMTMEAYDTDALNAAVSGH